MSDVMEIRKIRVVKKTTPEQPVTVMVWAVVNGTLKTAMGSGATAEAAIADATQTLASEQ